MMEIDTGAFTPIISLRQFEQIRQGSQQLQLTVSRGRDIVKLPVSPAIQT